MNSCGATTLNGTVIRGDEEIVEELMHAGANLLIQATKGCVLICCGTSACNASVSKVDWIA